MKIKRFYAKTAPVGAVLLTVLLALFGTWEAGAQGGGNPPIQFCGAYHAIPPNGTNPDSIIIDRFGNSFDLVDLALQPPGVGGGCVQAGYFSPTYFGNVPAAALPIICQVLTNVSSIIPQRQGVTDCGALASQGVTLQIAWLNFNNPDPVIVQQLGLTLPLPGVAGGIGTPFYSNPLDFQCHEVALDRPFIKINGGHPEPAGIFDGRILINSAFAWNFNNNLPTGGFPGLVDFHSVLLHEVMHVMGYASRMGFADAYSLWDQTLRVVDNYQPGGGGANPQRAIVNPSGCLSNCWQAIPNLANIAINSCSNALPGPDVVLGDAAIAAIGGVNINPNDPSALNGLLSHLSPTCSGQNVNYVMQSGITTNVARRVMTDAEQRIFCALGYQVQSQTVTCNGCYNIAHQDREFMDDAACCFKTFYACQGETIEVLNEEFLCNDITNGPQMVTRVWETGNVVSVVPVPNANGTGWLIPIPANYNSSSAIMNYTATGCDCRQHNALFIISVDQQCPPCTFTSDPCDNLLCISDFENFTNTTGIVSHLDWPIVFQGAEVAGSPDINVTNTGNHYLFLGNYNPNREAVNLELQKCIEPGCSLTMSMDLSGSNLDANFLEVWGSLDRPCDATVLGATPIAQNCGQSTVCDPSYTFEPVCIFDDEFLATSIFVNGDNPNFAFSGPFTWANQTDQNICFLTLAPVGGGIYLDNITAEIRCEPEITCNDPLPDDICQGEIANIIFQICTPEVPECLNLTLLTPTVILPSGWTLIGGNPGPFTLTEGLCQTITLQVQVPSNAPIGSMEMIMLSGTATGLCTTVEWSCSAKVTVIDCGQPQAFTCPCAAGGLNIDASENSPHYDPNLGGTRYSDLEADFNYDQNNNGRIDQNEHNDCIAILGNLIIDQNLGITGCDNVQMQPCSEITVGTNILHSTMNLDGNTIYACSIMWHGITVRPYATLNFKGNTIRDAQFAITAIGESGIGIDPPTKMIATSSTFSNNHIGVFFPGGPATTVVHHPFTSNTFNTTANLLMPCDANLPNHSITQGYAGVVTLGTSTTLGKTFGIGFANTFSLLRNGVISENAVLNVSRANFQNIIGANLPGVQFFGSASGNGIAANRGILNVFNCNFNNVRRGVYGNDNQQISVTASNMNHVWRGVETLNAHSSNISDNPTIGFAGTGVLYRGVIPAGGLNAHRIENNTNMFVSQFPGVGLAYYAAIDIDNLMSSDAGAASITNNHFFSGGNLSDGIRLNGSGGWDIAGNTIDFEAPSNPQFSNEGDGIRLTNTNENYLYQNHINDFDLSLRKSIGMSLSDGTGNRYCCNSTFGNKIGSYFLGACGSTEWRVTDMLNHTLALSCAAGTEISTQPDYGNNFNATSGTAFHNGGDIEVLNSQFIVVNTQQPHWPVAIATPNVTNAQFFDDGGLDAYCAAPCTAPMYAPPPPDRDIDGSDLTTVYGGYSGGLYGAALQWENERRLYERMNQYQGMIGTNNATDAFYTTATNSKIGAYYQAEYAAKGIYNYPSSIANGLQASAAQLESNRLAVETILAGLAQAQSSADSALIYQSANTQHQSGQAAAEALISYQMQAQAFSNAAAFDAYIATNSLSADNLLEQNRKTVQRLYLQTLGMGIFQLNPQQLSESEAIAEQCPLVGGSAVYAARALYRLNIDRVFVDDSLCTPSQERKDVQAKQFAVEGLSLVPNPASDMVSINGLSPSREQPVDVSLFDMNGKVCIHQVIETGEAALSIIGLLEGVYICQIKVSGKPPIALKLIIVHQN